MGLYFSPCIIGIGFLCPVRMGHFFYLPAGEVGIGGLPSRFIRYALCFSKGSVCIEALIPHGVRLFYELARFVVFHVYGVPQGVFCFYDMSFFVIGIGHFRPFRTFCPGQAAGGIISEPGKVPFLVFTA